MNIIFKKRGFGHQDAWVDGVKRARLSTTIGKQAPLGNYRVQFLPSLEAQYVWSLADALDIIRKGIKA